MKNYICKFSLCFTLSLFLLTSIAKAETLYSGRKQTYNALKNESINIENKDNCNINQEEEVVQVFNRGQVNLYVTQSQLDLLANLVYAESRGEPFEGKVAVASVVLNRVLSPKFPNTIEEVIFQPNAFSCVKNKKIVANPDESCYKAVYDALSGVDPSNQALFYYNPEIATCNWMKKTEKYDTCHIGHHVFFKA